MTIDDQEIKQELATFSRGVTSLRVTDQPTYDIATGLLVEIKSRQKRVAEFFAEMKSRAYSTWKEICSRETQAAAPLAEAEKHLKNEVSRWTIEQERLRREAERAAREEAERLAAEALERQIEEAESAGASVEEIAAICEMPVAAPVPPPPLPTFTQNTAVSTRKTYKTEVTDLKALCAAIGAGTVPANYVTPNMTALNARARADGATMNVPGVRVVVESGVAVRGRF